jgi:hypothetical protein
VIKHCFIFVFLTLIYTSLIGQNEFDTIYHPFYNGIQLIEVKPHEYIQSKKAFVQTAKTSEKIVSSTFILRDSTNTILTIFNNTASYSNNYTLPLRPLNTRVVPHKIGTENTSYTIGHDDVGYNMLYPIYHIDNSSTFSVGLMDSLGKMVFPVEFEHIQWIDSVFIAKKNGKYLLFNSNFKLISPDYLEEVNCINTIYNHILLRKQYKYALYSREGIELLPFAFDTIRISKYQPGKYEILQNGLWGFVDFDFKHILKPFSPTSKLLIQDAYFTYCDEEKNWNLIDSDGNVLFQNKLKVYKVISPNRFLIFEYDTSTGYKRYVCNSLGEVLTGTTFYDLWIFNERVLFGGFDARILDDTQLLKSTKWVLLDTNGQKINDKIYTYLLPIDETWMKAYGENGKLTVIDEHGTDVLGYTVDEIYKYSEHVYKIQHKGMQQFIDLYDTYHISLPYEQIQCIKENRIGVIKNGKWGFINTDFQEITPFLADQITCFSGGIAGVFYQEKWLIIDSLGRLISDLKFDAIKQLKNGLCQVKLNGIYGIINDKGDFVVPLIYKAMPFLVPFGESYFIGVKKDEKYGVINASNEIIYPFEFDECAEISEFASIPEKRMHGFYALMSKVNRSNIERYYFNFDPEKTKLVTSENPSKGFKIVTQQCGKRKLNQQCTGVVNWEGNVVIPFEYSGISDFKYNTFRCYSEHGGGLIDTTGTILVPPIYKYIYDLPGNCKLIQVGKHAGTWGLYDYSGRKIADTLYGGFNEPFFELIPFYADMHYRYDGKSGWIHDEERIGLMNFDGEIVLEPLYEMYRINDKKKQLTLYYQTNEVVVDSSGRIISGIPAKPDSETQPKSSTQKSKKHVFRNNPLIFHPFRKKKHNE